MANHARDERSAADKRSALISAQHNAYSHSDQVGGTRRREADGRWVDREPEPPRKQPKPISRMTLREFVAHNAAYILSVVAVVVIASLLVFGVRMFAGSASPTDDGGYTSPYDWSKLDRSDGRFAYVVDGRVKSRLGVDVAEHDHGIDWDSVAADGVDFAMIRLGYRGATEGELYLDEYYKGNMAGAKAAGLDRGIYFFSQAITVEEAIEEADFVLSNLGGEELDYPVAYDFEDVVGVGETRSSNLSGEELSAIADAFCDRIEAAGYQTLVYGNPHDLDSYNVDALTGRGIWWAEYGVDSPSHDMDIVIWQYTSSGSVDGIERAVDLNIDLAGVL